VPGLLTSAGASSVFSLMPNPSPTRHTIMPSASGMFGKTILTRSPGSTASRHFPPRPPSEMFRTRKSTSPNRGCCIRALSSRPSRTDERSCETVPFILRLRFKYHLLRIASIRHSPSHARTLNNSPLTHICRYRLARHSMVRVRLPRLLPIMSASATIKTSCAGSGKRREPRRQIGGKRRGQSNGTGWWGQRARAFSFTSQT
jgi:hypothetical protein